jgi:hypothetical protein
LGVVRVGLTALLLGDDRHRPDPGNLESERKARDPAAEDEKVKPLHVVGLRVDPNTSRIFGFIST